MLASFLSRHLKNAWNKVGLALDLREKNQKHQIKTKFSSLSSSHNFQNQAFENDLLFPKQANTNTVSQREATTTGWEEPADKLLTPAGLAPVESAEEGVESQEAVGSINQP